MSDMLYGGPHEGSHMLFRTAATLAIALALPLAGCNSTTSSSSALTAFETTVQNLTLAACHVIPAAESIASIMKANAGGLSQGAEIAAAICALVPPATPTTAHALLDTGTPRVPAPVVLKNGVTVNFVDAIGK